MLAKPYFEDMDDAKSEFKELMMKQILSETVGFAGCKMMRRQMGVAHILEIESIEDEKQRAIVEKAVIKLAREFVINFQKLANIREIFDTIKRVLR